MNKIIALAGNPNVGKSTVFNSLTGLKRHTGNWSGKTVTLGYGKCRVNGETVTLVDLPGAYSLSAKDDEEEVAANYVCYENPNAVIVVCDATSLERNLILALQIMELTPRVVLCVNLIDEAARKGIAIDAEVITREFGVPAVLCNARGRVGLCALTEAAATATGEHAVNTEYDDDIEAAISIVTAALDEIRGKDSRHRFMALRLLCGNSRMQKELITRSDIDADSILITSAIETAHAYTDCSVLKERTNARLVSRAADTASKATSLKTDEYDAADRKIDRFLTGRVTGTLTMFVLLAVVLFITIIGANYPSQWLSALFELLGGYIERGLVALNASETLIGLLYGGIYKTLTAVIAVMLPPMAIFFPLFTFLEDIGYLPRIAFNLDNTLRRCGACGKQALTMCMGFGCNAVGVTGCRIINSPKERAIAVCTNNFLPCNGRFPTIIAVLSMFFVGAGSFCGTLVTGVYLTAVILIGIAATFVSSLLLSKTVFRGETSSFVLELPPYRKPKIGHIVVDSLINRTLFVLGRAVVIAAPAGAVLFALANIHVDGISLLNHISGFLNPFASFFGMDGIILLAFILGFPANEIVIPIMLMAYLNAGEMIEYSSILGLRSLLVENSWTWVTAVCVTIFSLMHWPCSTTMITIAKETKSVKQTVIAFLLPTLFGLILCAIIANTARLFM